jgi:hypothetical protein
MYKEEHRQFCEAQEENCKSLDSHASLRQQLANCVFPAKHFERLLLEPLTLYVSQDKRASPQHRQ